MTTRLTNLRVDEGSLCEKGANQRAAVMLFKRAPVVKTATKTEAGQDYPAEAYAYVPDSETPSTWKLRLWEDPEKKETAAQVGRAVAALSPGGYRGNRVEIPAEDLPKVKAKVKAAWKRTHPDASDADVPDVLKKEGGVLGGLQRMVQAIGKRLGWTEADVENVTLEVAKDLAEDDGATTFGEELAEEQREAKYREVESELWDLVWLLRDAIGNTLRDETADRQALIQQSLDEFKGTILAALPAWLAGNTTVAKVGRKISADRLQRMKDAHQMLGEIIAEAEQDTTEPAATKTQKNDNRGVDKLPETKIDKAALPEDVRKYLEELEKKAQDLEAKGNQVPEEVTKQLDDLKKRADQAEEALRKERDERLTKEFVAKAAGFKNLPVKPEEFGPVMKSLAEKDPENYAKVEAALKAADEAAGKAGLLGEIGSSAAPAGGTAMAKLEGAAQELRKSDPNLSKEQAVAKALEQHPELYEDYIREFSERKVS